jgi:hypothetical protein
MRRAFVILLVAVCAAPWVTAQSGLDPAGVALRSHHAMVALDRYLEMWNSRDGTLWATTLNFPHVRPGAGAFEMTRTAEEYAAGVNFQKTLATGWDHSEWVTREVLHVGLDKVHAAGSWQRYDKNGKPLAGSDITYIVTNQNGRWGIQARFAAGVAGLDAAGRTKNEAAAQAAVAAFMKAWNSHDPNALAATLHYPHVRMADGLLEVWNTAEQFLAGPEPGRQRTWYQTRLDQSKVVQATSNGVNVSVAFSRLGRDGRVLTRDEGIFLVILRNSAWRVQARSTMMS